MSADDSICILKSPVLNGEGFEWRVQHLTSIQWELSDHQGAHGNVDQILNKIRELFKDAPVYTSEEDAEKAVDELDEELQRCGLPEYGPTDLTLTFPLWQSRKDREK